MKNSSVLILSLIVGSYSYAATKIASGSFMTIEKGLELIADGAPKKGTHSYYYSYWDLNNGKPSSVKKVGAGRCEFRAIVKDGPAKISIPAKSKYKISSLTTSPSPQSDIPANCAIMDEVFDGTETINTPKLQVTCCSETPIDSDEKKQSFLQGLEKSLKSIAGLSN